MGVAAAQLVGESADAPWHFHPEFELILILAGSGLRLVGDDVGVFTAGEVVLLGPELPHSWTSTSSRSEPARAAVIHFRDDVASLASAVPGSAPALDLLEAARGGALVRRVARGTRDDITSIAARSEVDLRSLGQLLQVLSDLADCDVDTLSSSVTRIAGRPVQQRIETIRTYLLDHHAEQITLGQAAAVAAMTPAAFSRFSRGPWEGRSPTISTSCESTAPAPCS